MSNEGAAAPLGPRLRAHLYQIPARDLPVTYQALARDLGLRPPNTILQLTTALEGLITQDAAHNRPLIAAFVISKARGGLPAPGFFDCAARAGCFDGAADGPEAAAFHAAELARAIGFWHGPDKTERS